tara:strand:- start:3455 stop:4756 length:1302 start_codon:yes stop_codon:yes gene_type:complete
MSSLLDHFFNRETVWDQCDKHIDRKNDLYLGFGPDSKVYWGFCDFLSQSPRYNDLDPDPAIENISKARVLSLFSVKQYDVNRVWYYCSEPPAEPAPGRARSWVYSTIKVSGIINLGFFCDFYRHKWSCNPTVYNGVRKMVFDQVDMPFADVNEEQYGGALRLFINTFPSLESLKISNPVELECDAVYDVWLNATQGGFTHVKKITIVLDDVTALQFCNLIPKMVMSSPKCTKFKLVCPDSFYTRNGINIAVNMAQSLLSQSKLRDISLPIWILSAMATETGLNAAVRRASVKRSLHRLTMGEYGFQAPSEEMEHAKIPEAALKRRKLDFTSKSDEPSPFDAVEIKTTFKSLSKTVMSFAPMCRFPKTIVITPMTIDADDETKHGEVCKNYASCVESILLDASPVDPVSIAVRFADYCRVILKWTPGTMIERYV